MITHRSKTNFAERVILGALTSGLKVLVVARSREEARAIALDIELQVPGVVADSSGDYKSRYRVSSGGSIEILDGFRVLRGRSYNLIAHPGNLTPSEMHCLRNRRCISEIDPFTMIALSKPLFSE